MALIKVYEGDIAPAEVVERTVRDNAAFPLMLGLISPADVERDVADVLLRREQQLAAIQAVGYTEQEVPDEIAEDLQRDLDNWRNQNKELFPNLFGQC